MKTLNLSLLFALVVNVLPVQFTEGSTTTAPVIRDPVKVYATPDNAGSITISSNQKKVLSFYLFNLTGQLIYQTELKASEGKIISGLAKGTYLYNAFTNDTHLEEGKVVLR